MTPLEFILVASAGGLGAAARFFLDGLLRDHTKGTLPVGTVLINFSGSLLLGLIIGLVSNGLVPAEIATTIGTGMLGGYTTFSTASVETIRLAEQHRYGAATLNSLGALAICTLAAGAGIWLGTLP